ncbi:hypothetical protein BKN38_04795 [Helicobacter sp. CLO-3]|nr:hypothetical protein BA723_09540 [Helicobacter sp. CLO-3]OHU83907.1 hypothetical protein BKN38_04795 [Helicobacter sp. CLO-3]
MQGRHSQELENYEKELQAKVDKLQQKRLESLLAQKRVIDNPSSLHPHETIDIPLDQIHTGAKIGDITAKSQRLEKAFLDSSGRVDTKKLNAYTTPLPKALNREEFLKSFPQTDKNQNTILQTPMGKLIVNVKGAWEHMNRKNTYRKDRSRYSGAFLLTLRDPLFVVKQKYNGVSNTLSHLPQTAKNAKMQNGNLSQSIDRQIIAQDSYAFFKPFSMENGFKYMVGYALDINGNLVNTTFYPLGNTNLSKIKKMMQGKDEDLLYFKEAQMPKYKESGKEEFGIMPKNTQGKQVASNDIIKLLESSPNKGRDMPVIGRENLTPEILGWSLQNKARVAIEKINPQDAKKLGFKYTDDVRRTISSDEILHTLKRHGKESALVKQSKQKAVELEDISNYVKYADNADKQVVGIDNEKKPVIISGKQINGYYVIVEQIRKGQNELSFKTMYFENGKLENNEAFKRSSSNAT